MLGKAKTTLFEENKQEFEPQHPDKITIIDADTIAYAVCSVCETGDDEAGYIIDLDYALSVAVDKVKAIQHATSTGKVELHFTVGQNFRYVVDKDYKSNRVGQRTPVGLSDLKHKLVEHFEGSMLHAGIEADDYVVWAKKFNPEKYILSAVDKDVLNSVAGTHYNYYSNDKYNIKPKWEEVLKTRPLPWFYLQVLMGDSGDGITGLPGVAGVKAFDILAPYLVDKRKALTAEYKATYGKAPSDPLKAIIIGMGLIDEVNQDEHKLYDLVLKAYESKGLTEKELTKTARLVSMHQLNEKGDLDLWIRPLYTDIKQGEE